MVLKMRQVFDLQQFRVEVDKLGKVIVYLRKSREDMIDGRYASDEETLSRHEEQLQSWAKNTLGYEIPQEYIFKEVGSGEKIKSRPVFQKVLSLVEKEDIDGVLVVNCSRLSRGDLTDCGHIIKTFEITKTLVLTPPKIYNLQDKHDKRYFKDELLRGNDYLEQAKELLANGRHWSTAQGKFVGSVAPYGYDKVTCKEMKVGDERGFTLRPNENAEYVRMVFDMYNDGVGCHRIASHLNNIGAPHPENKKWDHCRVRNILKVSTYCGLLTWGKVTKKERITDGEVYEYRAENKDYPIYKGLHTAIISEDVFRLAQARAKGNGQTSTRSDYDTKNPLASFLKCGLCGRSLARNPYYGQTIRKRKYALDKAELQKFIVRHKKALKLTNAEIADRLGIKKHYANEWFGKKADKFYPADLFVEKWADMKALLQIEDDRFDDPVTVFEDFAKPETLSCSGQNCDNVSTYLYIVEEKILSRIKERIKNYTYFLDNYAEEIIKKSNTAKKKAENLDKKIAMVERQLKNAKIAYEQEVDTLQEYIERKKELNGELDGLLKEKATSTEIVEEEKTVVIKKAVPILQNVFKDYPLLNAAEKNELLKTVIEEATYIKEKKNSTDINDISLDICWLI